MPYLTFSTLTSNDICNKSMKQQKTAKNEVKHGTTELQKSQQQEIGQRKQKPIRKHKRAKDQNKNKAGNLRLLKECSRQCERAATYLRKAKTKWRTSHREAEER